MFFQAVVEMIFQEGGPGQDEITDVDGNNDLYGGEGDDFISATPTDAQDSNKYFGDKCVC